MRITINRSRSKGATMVEFALIASILFTVIFGIIDFGRYMFAMATINYAAQQGARTGLVGSPASAIVTSIQTTAGWAVKQSDLTITFFPVTYNYTAPNPPYFTDPANTAVQTQGGSGAYMRLRVQYTFSFLALRPLFPAGTKTISASVLYQNENFD